MIFPSSEAFLSSQFFVCKCLCFENFFLPNWKHFLAFLTFLFFNPIKYLVFEYLVLDLKFFMRLPVLRLPVFYKVFVDFLTKADSLILFFHQSNIFFSIYSYSFIIFLGGQFCLWMAFSSTFDFIIGLNCLLFHFNYNSLCTISQQLWQLKFCICASLTFWSSPVKKHWYFIFFLYFISYA